MCGSAKHESIDPYRMKTSDCFAVHKRLIHN